MAKFALFLLALVAVQVCYGASVSQPKLNEEFATAMREVEEIISSTKHDLSAVVREFEHKISEIVLQRPVSVVIEHLGKTITKLESESSDDGKSCFNRAWTKTSLASEDLKEGVDKCLTAAHSTRSHIKSILETTERTAVQIQSSLLDGYKCKEEEIDEDEVKCLREVVEPLQKELLVLKDDLKVVNKLVDKNVTDAAINLDICLENLENKNTLKSNDILSDLNRCIQEDNNTTNSSSGEISKSNQEIQDLINKIIYQINISTQFSNLKQIVHNIGNSGSHVDERCSAKPDEELNTIIKSAEDAAKICMGVADGNVEEIGKELENLANEAKGLLVEFNNQTIDYILENKLEFPQSDSFNNLVYVLQKKLTNSLQKINPNRATPSSSSTSTSSSESSSASTSTSTTTPQSTYQSTTQSTSQTTSQSTSQATPSSSAASASQSAATSQSTSTSSSTSTSQSTATSQYSSTSSSSSSSQYTYI